MYAPIRAGPRVKAGGEGRASLLLTTPHPTRPTQFAVNLEGKKASFTIEVHPEWAPLGAARFEELVSTANFFDGVRFFRVIKGFMAQFGIPAKPAVAKEWKDKKIKCGFYAHAP